MKLRRLPHTEATREKISEALRGREKSPETRAKLAEARRGRKHSPETIAKITAARRARPRKTPEAVIEAGREAATKRRAGSTNDRIKRWKRDQLEALRMGNHELYRDVKQSWGYRNRRRVFDPTGRVSDGQAPPKTAVARKESGIRV